MKPTPEQLARGLVASYALRDHGDQARGLKPISFTGDPSGHVRVIAEAVLKDVPEPSPGIWLDVSRIGDYDKPRLRWMAP